MNRILLAIVIVLIVVALGWYFLAMPPEQTGTNATSTATSTGQTTTQTQSDGTITVTVPAEFGLATNPQQVLVTSYIPPCDEGFLYCLYYNADAYENTNFESAGVSIAKRSDLSTERLCLDTAPAGYEATVTPDDTSSADAYSTSVFEDVGDAGAGHVAAGDLHRLFVRSNSNCYELQTRIGNAQFANFPEGSIEEFTQADRTALEGKLNAILQGVTLSSGPVSFSGI